MSANLLCVAGENLMNHYKSATFNQPIMVAPDIFINQSQYNVTTAA